MSEQPDDVKRRLATEAGRAMLDDAARQAKEKLEGASTNTKLKIIGGVVGVGVLGIAVLGLVMKLWQYAILALIVGGVGLATYLFVKPKLTAFKQAAEQKLLAGQRAREEGARVQAAADAETAKKKKLEDELEALRKKAL
jgi:hypothetical protein